MSILNRLDDSIEENIRKEESPSSLGVFLFYVIFPISIFIVCLFGCDSHFEYELDRSGYQHVADLYNSTQSNDLKKLIKTYLSDGILTNPEYHEIDVFEKRSLVEHIIEVENNESD